MVSPHSPKTVRESEMEKFITRGSGAGTQHPSRHSTPQGATQRGQSKVKANNLNLKEKIARIKTTTTD